MNLLDVIHGEVIDQQLRLGIADVAARAHVQDTFVIELVDYGVLEPFGRTLNEWQFSGTDLYKLRCVARLIRDLHVNVEGAAVILDLLEERQRMRSHLELLEGLIGGE
jgi:chaperone modulatory protein CbpM